MTTTGRTRVFVADEHPLFVEAVQAAIRERPGLELVGSATSGPEAAAGISALRPDVAVVDLRLSGLSGLELLRRTTAERAATRIVVLSADVDTELVYAALAGGAAGYLSKEDDRDAICDAIAAAARGEIVLSPQARRSLAGAIRQRDGTRTPALTPREQAVLALAADGCSTREIATRLGVSSATVKAHLRGAYTKLDVPDRTSAVAAALRRGLLPGRDRRPSDP